MKIELVKETKNDESIMYFVQVDGVFVSGTLTYDESKSKDIYQNVVQNKGRYCNKEVVESIEL